MGTEVEIPPLEGWEKFTERRIINVEVLEGFLDCTWKQASQIFLLDIYMSGRVSDYFPYF